MKAQQCESLREWEAAIRRWSERGAGLPMPELSAKGHRRLRAIVTRDAGEHDSTSIQLGRKDKIEELASTDNSHSPDSTK